MRIWSVHPEYLDVKGLVALWRETLLAKHVLLGLTRGYTNHPQLNRFKAAPDPVNCIDYYLSVVYAEALNRGYHFDKTKFNKNCKPCTLSVTSGQMQYETKHLLNKLKLRDPGKFKQLSNEKLLAPHPVFTVIEGPIESWEVII
ncbi:MAG: hypothetical protein A2W93_09040 [Bacteroidetes bacterium GWF2_43_63]|nr:MAG: hypothetical protein A2W94_05420 [Bacteroidetes bacterium GWE2_42_42]OFY54442.1 MAG: hypothetical protein A2W93_09040 [Bacteroidetes bacterium GWF2_43_63]HBG70390.1 hypothetical protein [Bacteroidales bacterium]HCB63493.1 hypothetical protein [Bacteroidales bacterium]